jgi:hypothetical protein
MVVLLRIEGKYSHVRAKPAHFSGHLPEKEYKAEHPGRTSLLSFHPLLSIQQRYLQL